MLITNRDLSCLLVQTGANKEQLKKAIAAVGNHPAAIEQYLQQQAKPHLMQLLNSKVVLHEDYN